MGRTGARRQSREACKGRTRLEGIAAATDRLGTRLCDVSIQYQDDFFEWSIQFVEKPFPDPCAIATELARQTIVLVK